MSQREVATPNQVVEAVEGSDKIPNEFKQAIISHIKVRMPRYFQEEPP